VSKADLYRAELRKRRDWDGYLRANSGLPGPRGNLELLEVAGDEATEEMLWRWSESDDEYLGAVGAAGLGRFALTDPRVMRHLERLAADPRWRVREGVAMALQRIGRRDMGRLLRSMRGWIGKRPYVQRAVAAGLCEPALLKDTEVAAQVLDVLDRITASVVASTERKSDEVRVLRQALGYCWSVAAAAAPERARPLFERLLASTDPDVRWIVKSNFAKSRMSALGAQWLGEQRRRHRL
jgi:HEAT repeat protein